MISMEKAESRFPQRLTPFAFARSLTPFLRLLLSAPTPLARFHISRRDFIAAPTRS
jgi:hypothetical protein